jgi:putative nucleotidyltransferase with HDIG domain
MQGAREAQQGGPFLSSEIASARFAGPPKPPPLPRLNVAVQPLPRVNSDPAPAISFSAIISALTFAIDLTEGAVPGHALRTCVLGMRLAQAIQVPRNTLAGLYYALLLKDVGCSANEARMENFTPGAHYPDHENEANRSPLAGFKSILTRILPEDSTLRRQHRERKLSTHLHPTKATMIVLRCERGANIVRKLGLSTTTSDAIYALDEHWDGSGHPWHLGGTDIPLFARICAVAQHLDVYASEHGAAVAMAELRRRSGVWFDPALVDAAEALHAKDVLWAGCLPTEDEERVRRLVMHLEPEAAAGVEPETIDRICEAFADVVDAKSPFTYRHSVGVAEVSVALCEALGLPAENTQLVRRAALLHDLGKLAIPNTILDKRGRLTDAEWLQIVEHPRLTRQILSRIAPFQELAQIAGAHHEKLDGSGYPDKLTADQLSLEARIIAVADCYQAVTEGRPYRASIGHHAAFEMLRRMTPNKLDSDCVAALRWMRLPEPKWLGA